jgi:hypothetical protein
MSAQAKGLAVVAALLGLATLAGCAAPTSSDEAPEGAALGTTASAMTISERVGAGMRRCEEARTQLVSLSGIYAPKSLSPFQVESWTNQDALFAKHAARCADWSSRAGAAAGAHKTSFAEKLAEAALADEHDDMAAQMTAEAKKFVTLSSSSWSRQVVAIDIVSKL